jgi:type IV fimbrial biogenesis protein FimT
MQVLSYRRDYALVVMRKLSARGFGLVELLITMAIALVLIMIAVPSFKSITLSSKLTTTANSLVMAIDSARMEAIKRNASTQMCGNTSASNSSGPLGAACTTETGAVYALTGTTTTRVLAGTPGLVTPLQLSGNVVALRFNGRGQAQQAGTSTPYSGMVADICTSSMSSNNHRQIQMTAGTILVTTSSSGTCP